MSRASGWLGPLPVGWTLMKLKRIARLRAGEAITSDAIAEEGLYPVFGGNGVRGYTSAYTHRGPHVLIGRQGALCGNINHANGCFWASEHAVVATILGDDDVRWLGALLGAMDLNQYSQSAAQPGISIGVVANLEVPVPPVSAQRTIADYLDRETSRIDRLIDTQQRLVERVQERFAVAQQQLIIGKPNGSSRPGVHQGSLASGWRAIPFRWLFREIDERSTSGEEELLSVSQTRGVILQSELGGRGQQAESYIGYKLCQRGDLIVNRMWVYYGALGIARQRGLVSPDYSVFRAVEPGLDADLVAATLKSPAFVAEMTMGVRGIGSAFQGSVRKPRLHPRELGEILIPVPPDEARAEVARRILAEEDRRSHLTSAGLRFVELLRERRAALVTAAVTGQIDVVNEAA